MPNLKEKEWREIARRTLWTHADYLRKETIDDNPSLDVRMRYENAEFIVEISGPEKK